MSTGSSSSSSDGLFPDKLHDVLDYAEKRGLNNVIEWTDRGHSFMVHDPAKLLQLLPKFFGQTQYRSFQRQLGMWYFDRIQQPGDGGRSTLYRHPYFIRGQKAICKNLTREMFKRDPVVKRYVKSKSTTTNNDSSSKTKNNNFIRKTQSDSSLRPSSKISSPAVPVNPSIVTMGQNVAIFPCRRPSDPIEYHSDSMISGVNVGGGGILFDTEDVTATEITSSGGGLQDGDPVEFEGRQFFFLERDSP